MIQRETFKKISRFVVSGIIGALVHFSLLILLVEHMETGILLATTIAFICASILSFTLQKLWTFKNHTLEILPHQILFYIAIGLVNLAANALSMHLLVQIAGWHYLPAQIITSGVIAIESYLFYKHLVFPHGNSLTDNSRL